MAIINCKECGQEISSKAEKCPKCGNPIKGASNEGCFLQTLNIGCMFTFIVIVLIIIGAIIGAMTK